MPALIKMAQDESPARRKTAIETLGNLRAADTAAARTVIGALKDPVVDVRLAAVTAIGLASWYGESPLPALTASLRDESAPVRELAARTLSAMGALARNAMPELTRVAEEDKEQSVRRAAGEALRKMESRP